MRVYFPGGSMSVSREFKAGEPQPKDLGYSEFDEWHEAQRKAGLRQKECGQCCKWWYPQDIASSTVTQLPDTMGRMHDVESVVCADCAAKARGK